MSQQTDDTTQSATAENGESEIIPVSTITNYLIPIGLFSSFIAYLRNSNSNIIIKVFYMVIAYLLNVFYLAYVAYKFIFPSQTVT
jgi:hypothetical protein